MKLEIGMYCFNKTNRKLGIGKIATELSKHNNVAIAYKNEIIFVSGGNVVASHNIIDLIEVGDYVNGYKVILTGIEELGHKFITLDWDIHCEGLHWGKCNEIENSEDIKSIVTKEQFESMEYKVD